MRQIGVIGSEYDARRFGDYLLAMNIANQIEENSAGQWAIWVERDDCLEKAARELEAFQSNPADPRYTQAASTAQRVRAASDKREQKWRKQFVDVRTSWSQTQRLRAPLTMALIGICVVVYILSLRSRIPSEGIDNQLFIEPILKQTPNQIFFQPGLDAVRHGQIWRLITPIFIHFGILHIAFNMFWLFDLGTMIETKRSTWFLAALVIFSAVPGNLAQYFWTNNPSFGGMSGVVYGLFGYVWLKGLIDPSAGMGVSSGVAWLMFGWLVACMVGFLGPIANEAHVVGLLVGVVLAFIPYVYRKAMR